MRGGSAAPAGRSSARRRRLPPLHHLTGNPFTGPRSRRPGHAIPVKVQLHANAAAQRGSVVLRARRCQLRGPARHAALRAAHRCSSTAGRTTSQQGRDPRHRLIEQLLGGHLASLDQGHKHVPQVPGSMAPMAGTYSRNENIHRASFGHWGQKGDVDLSGVGPLVRHRRPAAPCQARETAPA